MGGYDKGGDDTKKGFGDCSKAFNTRLILQS